MRLNTSLTVLRVVVVADLKYSFIFEEEPEEAADAALTARLRQLAMALVVAVRSAPVQSSCTAVRLRFWL